MKSDYGKPAREMGWCIRECENRDKVCGDCFRFSKWVLPDTVTLSTLALWLEEREEWLAWGRCKHIIKSKGLYTKINAHEALEILREEE